MDIVKKDNALVNAAYTLTLTEQRLVLLAIVEAAGQPDELKDMVVHAHTYAKRFGVNNDAAYKALNDATRQLFERRFSYQRLTSKGNLNQVHSRWVQRVEYIESEGAVMLSFAKDVIPLLCNLKNHFTYYGLEHVARLSSAHAVRLYELLIAWRATGKTPMLKLAEFRQRLGIEPDEYPRMTDFKRRVLDVAVQQINKYTDIIVLYEQYKQGRSVSGFCFTLKAKLTVQKNKRKTITKKQAEEMARPGESYPELYKRLSSEYIIK